MAQEFKKKVSRVTYPSPADLDIERNGFFFPFQNLNRTLLKIEYVKHQKARSGIVQEEFLYTCHRLMVRLYTLCIYEHGYIYIYVFVNWSEIDGVHCSYHQSGKVTKRKVGSP